MGNKSQYTPEQRKWFANEYAKLKQRLRTGFKAPHTKLQLALVDVIDTLEDYEELKSRFIEKYYPKEEGTEQ